MCIYFDAHIYDDPLVRSDELLYQYLYHIIYMLSCKAKYFEGPNSWKKYDEFALYAATKIYLRYTTHTDPASRIKSVLNYCKNLLYPMKVDWQKETFNEIIGSREINDSCYDLQTSLENSVSPSPWYENTIAPGLERLTPVAMAGPRPWAPCTVSHLK